MKIRANDNMAHFIGDTFNPAQRLQAVAARGQIIIGEHAYEKIKR